MPSLKAPHQVVIPRGLKLEGEARYKRLLTTMLENLRRNATNHRDPYQKKYKRTVDRSRRSHDFEIGDAVLYFKGDRRKGNKAKLLPPWEGPYTIVKWINPQNKINAVITSLSNPLEKRTTHVSSIRPYYSINKSKRKVKHLHYMQAEESKDELSRYVQQLGLFDLPAYRRKKWASVPRTPSILATMMAAIAQEFGSHICDLMAGDGNLTRHLGQNVLAVEKEQGLIALGRKHAPTAKWLKTDLRDSQQVVALLQQYANTFQVVISNPAFDLSFIALRIALKLLRNDKKSRCIFLLPMDWICGSKKRRTMFDATPVAIEKVYHVGRWNYYQDVPGSSTRYMDDAIFVFKPAEIADRPIQYETQVLTPQNFKSQAK
jgi:hypothetical protein